MIKLLWHLIKLLLPLLPFLLFTLLNAKANLPREQRSRQYLMPIFALVYCLALITVLEPINKFLLWLLNLLPDVLQAVADWFASILDGRLSGIGQLFASLGKAIQKLLLKVNAVYILFFIENCLFLVVHILLKRILLAFLKRICTPGKPLHERIAGLFYDHDADTEDWFIKKNMGQARTFLLGAYVGTIAVTCLASLVSMWLFRIGWLSSLFFPVFGVIIVGELCFFLGGKTRKELEDTFEEEETERVKGIDFRGLRDALRRLFGDKLAAEDTLVCKDLGEVRSNDELLTDLESDGDTMLEAYARFMRRKVAQGLKPDQNYLNTGRDLLQGKSILFNNPFYYDLIPYIFYPLNRSLLQHRKVLVVLGRHDTEDDVAEWCRSGVASVTSLPDIWRIGVLGRSSQDLDIGIVTRSDVHDLELHESNREFFAKVGFVVLIEPSRLVTTAQVGLNSIVRHCRAEDPQVTYCSFDKNCDGLVDSLSHILMTSLTEVSATNRPEGLSSYMCWNPDTDLLQHRMLPNIARYLGVGTELAFTGLKNQAPRADWYGGDAFPVTDMNWIARQYYYDLLNYANRPAVQEGMEEYFHTTHNLWNARVEADHYMVVEDESFNMFEVRREFSTRAKEQGFVNVISQAYLLRDYMAENSGLFNADPKAIPYIVADYARTERNVALRLCLRMAACPVLEDEVRRELLLVNQDTEHPQQSLWHMLCASWYSERIPVSEDGEEYLEVKHRGETLRFTSAVLERSRKFSVDTGRVENLYRIHSRSFIDTVLRDLQSAGYIAEDEQGQQQYLGTELRGQIFQKYLPGQFFTLGGKYYQMLRVAADGNVLVRRAADHISGRPQYRQVRRYTLSELRDSDTMGDRLDVAGMKITKQFADIRVETSAYWDLPDYNDFERGRLVSVNGVPDREYRRKQVLRIDLPEALNPTPEICQTLALLFNEVFRTLFAENQNFIVAVTPGEAEAPLTYSLRIPEDARCLYIIEDSQLDIGLLEAVRRNLNRIYEIICDYLNWHTETLEADLNPPKTPEPPENTPADNPDGPADQQQDTPEEEEPKTPIGRLFRKLRNFFRKLFEKIRDFFRKLFRRKPKDGEGEAPGSGTEEKPADHKETRKERKARRKAEKEKRKAEKQAEKEKRKAEKEAEREAKRRKKKGEPEPAPVDEVPETPAEEAPQTPEETPQTPEETPQTPDTNTGASNGPDDGEAGGSPDDANGFIPLASISAAPLRPNRVQYAAADTDGGSEPNGPEPGVPASGTGEGGTVDTGHEGTDTVDFEHEEVDDGTDAGPELKRKPYHKRYYLLYGGSSVPAPLDVAGTLELLKALGFEDSALRQARKNKGIADLVERTFVPNLPGGHYCDFCGCELLGNDYEVLKDGRERCLKCGKTSIKSLAEFQKIYREVHRNLETFFGAKLTVPIHVQMVNAKKVNKAFNRSFVPTGRFDPRVLGVAIQKGKSYEILIENGAPRLMSIMTMAHEMTHIWQYTHWDAKEIQKLYGRGSRQEIYEGMAMWAEIQYAYLIGETDSAKREEIITRSRDDEYGRGFVRYAQKYPLTESTSLSRRKTPFSDVHKPL